MSNNNNNNIVNVPYSILISETNKKNLKLFYILIDNKYYNVLAGAATYILKSEITNNSDIQDFQTNYQNYAIQISCDAEAQGLCSPLECEGVPLVATITTQGLKANLITPNWCDPTTWYYSSVYTINETAVLKDGYDGYVYTLSHKNIIDTYHGKITGENLIHDIDGYSYLVNLTIDNVQKIEVDPSTGLGDFVINYALGEITFSSKINQNSTVLVTYHYENGSTHVLYPDPGTVFRIKGIECQFSADVIMNDSMVYEVWAYNPNNLPNKMLATSPDVYKTIWDFINDANKAYPKIPILGGTSWRGMKTEVYVFSWDLQSSTDLYSSLGMELRIRLEHNIPYGGNCCTGIFYCVKNNE